MSKHQVVHEQKFKDLLSSTCQVSVERIVLDLESEAAWVLFPPGITFCHWLFSRSKASDVNIANFINLRKTYDMPILKWSLQWKITNYNIC